MAQQVAPLNLYKWTEADPFKVSEVNENFRILSEHVDLKSSGNTPALNSSITWRVKKYYDGTVELYCRVPVSSACSTVNGSVYRSASMSVLFPANVINSIDNIQLTASSATESIWAVNQTPNTDNSGVTFCCISPVLDTVASFVDILVKGAGS